MNKSIVVGLTGQTGSGKSTVSKFMENISCTIINADKIARKATETGSDCLKSLAEHFGYDIINNDGSCNRKLLAKRAFSSKKNTDILNSLTHPFIINLTKEQIKYYKEKQKDIIIFDAPQLFESGGNSICDVIVSVVAPKQTRMKRIMDRDMITEEEALLRMNVQYNDDFFITNSDYVIDGSLSLEQVKLQAEKIIAEIRKSTEVSE